MSISLGSGLFQLLTKPNSGHLLAYSLSLLAFNIILHLTINYSANRPQKKCRELQSHRVVQLDTQEKEITLRLKSPLSTKKEKD